MIKVTYRKVEFLKETLHHKTFKTERQFEEWRNNHPEVYQWWAISGEHAKYVKPPFSAKKKNDLEKEKEKNHERN